MASGGQKTASTERQKVIKVSGGWKMEKAMVIGLAWQKGTLEWNLFSGTSSKLQ